MYATLYVQFNSFWEEWGLGECYTLCPTTFIWLKLIKKLEDTFQGVTP